MPSFWLEYDNNGDIQEFSFEADSVTIGRDKSSDFVLDHPTVSRQHAVIVYKNGSYYLVVLSRGGLTAVDGQQSQGEVMLYDGNMLNLGQLQFRFRSNHAPQKPANQQQMGQQQMGQQQMGQQQMGQQQMGQQGGFDQQAQQGGFGQQAQQPQQQGGFGGQQSQQGGFGQQAQQPQQQGGFGGQQSQQGGFGMGDSPAQGTPNQADGADGTDGSAQESGIISWDEIASSSEAMEDGKEGGEASVYERMQSAKKDEQTNPALVGIAGIAIIGLLYYTFFTGGGATEIDKKEVKPVSEQIPVVVEVSCMGESACLKKAKQAYKVGSEKLEKKDAAISNLFDGYKKLLESEKFLEKAGKTATGAGLNKLEPKRKAAREELTALFKNYRVKYHQAKKRSEYRKMAQALDAIRTYFPDNSARENKWAYKQELEMKKKGIYPKYVYPPR